MDVVSLFENQNTSGYNYLKIKLHGPSQNPSGIGAEVKIFCNTNIQSLRQQSTRGYCSSSLGQLHFGLGTSEFIDSLQVIWPDGMIDKTYNLTSNQLVELSYGNALPHSILMEDEDLFKNVTTTILDHQHIENKFSPFKNNPLQYRHFAKEGPALIAADFNDDSEIDLFIGGAAQQPGHLFLQKEGRFIPAPWPSSSNYEDVDALALDVDGDHDLDLYVVSGGSTYKANSKFYQDRIYLNDGHGRFNEDPTALPLETTSGACAAAGDMDADGDLDLFIGGRHVPGDFVQIPKSRILENRHGKFHDVTAEWHKSIADVGMVTSATWTDYDGDQLLDLLVVGEWMDVHFFKNSGQAFQLRQPKINGVGSLSGWWQHITANDLDADGDVDLFLGNMGLNTGFSASEQLPLRWYIGDLNKDGITEGILAHYRTTRDVHQKEVIYHRRDELLSHMPDQQKIWDTYAAFAEGDVVAHYKGEITKVREVETLASGTLLNRGDGTYDWKPWPMEAQFSAVRDLAIQDLNEDGQLDLVCIGNADVFRVETGSQDAAKGLVLLGDGIGDFKVMNARKSGFLVEGDARKIASYKQDGQIYYVVALNDGKTTVWKKNEQDQ